MNKCLTLLFALAAPGLLANPIALPMAEGDTSRFTIEGETGTFDVTLGWLFQADGIARYSVRFPSPVMTDYERNNTVIGELYLPENDKLASDPAILLHILNGNFELERLFAMQLAKAGAPAFWFKLPYYGERRPPQITSSRPVSAGQLLNLLDQGVEDYKRACDFMGTFRRSGQPLRVDLAGISMGGILAYYFASQEPRTGKICSIMSGGDLWGIIAHARETRGLRHAISQLDEAQTLEFREALAVRDPLHAADKLRVKAAAGDILMVNASEDEVIPSIYAQRLADALGIGDQIVWIEDVGHYSIAAKLNEVIENLVAFFTGKQGVSLPELPSMASLGAELDAEAVLVRFLSDLGVLLNPMAVMKGGQILDVDFDWIAPGASPASGHLSWSRTGQGGFALKANTTQWGNFGVGQSSRPWLYMGPSDLLLQGNDPVVDASLFTKGGGGLMLKLQLLSNMLQFGVRVPGLLQESGTLDSLQDGDYLTVSYNIRRRGIAMELVYQISSQQFVNCVITTRSGEARLRINGMSIDTTVEPSRLVPPKAREVLAVSSSNLQHTMAMVLEIIDDKVNVWK